MLWLLTKARGLAARSRVDAPLFGSWRHVYRRSGANWKIAVIAVAFASVLVTLSTGLWADPTNADTTGTLPPTPSPSEVLDDAEISPLDMQMPVGDLTSFTVHPIDAAGQVNEGLPGVSFHWSVVSGTSILLSGTITGPTVTVTGASPGVAVLRVRVTQDSGALSGVVEKDVEVAVFDPDVTVDRAVSNSTVQPGEEVTITVQPTNVDLFYAVEESLGELDLVSHTADNLAEGVFVMLSGSAFDYVVRVPFSAQPGDTFSISGEFWEDPEIRRETSPATTTITVGDPIPAVDRALSSNLASAGEEVTVTLSPANISLFYAVQEGIGDLELVSNTADNFVDGIFIVLGSESFEYVVRVPATAQEGDTFPISGEFWEDPEDKSGVNPPSDVITVGVPPTPTPTPTATPSSGGGGGGGGGGGAPPPPQPTSTPAPSTPSAPQNVQAEPGDGSIVISWDAPDTDGGAPVTGYRILNLATAQAVTVDADVRSHTVTALTNGVEYSFQISAINVSGNGQSVIIGPFIPAAPLPVDPDLNDAAQAAFGDDVEVTDAVPSIGTSESGVTAIIAATGLDEGQGPTGPLEIDSDDLVVSADSSGNGTATIGLSDELQISGPVEITGAADGIAIQFQQASLVFAPAIEPDEQAALPADVGVPNVQFAVELTSVSGSPTVTAQFSPTVPTQVVSTTFSLQGALDPAVIGDPSNDVAYSVVVDKSGVDNDQLGDNTVTMRVGDAWHSAMTQAGKTIVITKLSDNGQVFSEPASCTQNGPEWVCTATFSGAAGGFSEFTLLALTAQATPTAQAAQPTSTPPVFAQPTGPPSSPTPTTAPVPTSTVTPSPTVTPEPTEKPTAQPSPSPVPTPTPQSTATPVTAPLPTPVVGPGSDEGTPTWVPIAVGVGIVAFLGALVGLGVIRPRLRNRQSL